MLLFPSSKGAENPAAPCPPAFCSSAMPGFRPSLSCLHFCGFLLCSRANNERNWDYTDGKGSKMAPVDGGTSVSSNEPVITGALLSSLVLQLLLPLEW